jgi:hypothetical protein
MVIKTHECSSHANQFPPLCHTLNAMHKVRRQSLENCILSAAMKSHLTVTSLGRSIGTKAYEKHRIKSADRLLSNLNLHHEIPDIYRQISRLFLSCLYQPVLLVDWSDMEPETKELPASRRLGMPGPLRHGV